MIFCIKLHIYYRSLLSHIIKRDGIVLELSYKIKSVCILYYYMTIDIHKAIGKLPKIPKKGFVLPIVQHITH